MVCCMIRRPSMTSARIQHVLALAAEPGCQTAALVGYFGERLGEPCGHCTSCRLTEPRAMPPASTRAPIEGCVDSAVFTALFIGPPGRARRAPPTSSLPVRLEQLAHHPGASGSQPTLLASSSPTRLRTCWPGASGRQLSANKQSPVPTVAHSQRRVQAVATIGSRYVHRTQCACDQGDAEMHGSECYIVR
jgi:hypothetical protein